MRYQRTKPFVDRALQGAEWGDAMREVRSKRIPLDQLEVGVIYQCDIDRVSSNGLARYMGDGRFLYEVPPDDYFGIRVWTLASASDESLDEMSSLVCPIRKTKCKFLRGEKRRERQMREEELKKQQEKA